jgi:hypothetical protein
LLNFAWNHCGDGLEPQLLHDIATIFTALFVKLPQRIDEYEGTAKGGCVEGKSQENGFDFIRTEKSL